MSDTDHRRRGGATRAHVVLFRFMLQGHVAPFRCLAALVRRCRPDARLTVVATPGIAEAFRAHLVADGVGDGRLAGVHALPFHPAEHGLPAGADTSAGIGFQQLITLFLASESIRPAFRRFVNDLRAANPGDDIHFMTDMFLGWAVDVAPRRRRIELRRAHLRRLRLGALLLAVGQRPASGDRLPRRGLPAAAVPGRPRAALATYQPPRGGRRQGRVVHVHPEADRRLLPRRRAARQHGGELGAEGAKHAPSMAQRPDLPRRPAAPLAGAIAGSEEDESHPGVARRATTRLCAVHIFRIAVQDHCAADDGARERARTERSQVRLGDPAAGGARRERRVPAGVAAGGVQRACGGRGARAGGAVLGAAGGDPGARRHRRVPDALWLELRAGGARPRRAAARVAALSGTILQLQAARGWGGNRAGVRGGGARVRRRGRGHGGGRRGDGAWRHVDRARRDEAEGGGDEGGDRHGEGRRRVVGHGDAEVLGRGGAAARRSVRGRPTPISMLS